ncbi:MAG: hypothetical protein ACYTFA_17140 [Planctomycetota bacterium]
MALETLSVPDAARCKTCGYALRGLCDPRCPECGGPFDPNDSTTYAVGRPKPVLDHRWTVVVPCFILAVVGNHLLGIPVRALAVFPSWLWSDSLFHGERSVVLLLTAGAFILLLAHPVRPNGLTALLTVVGAIGWYLLSGFTYVVLATANC